MNNEKLKREQMILEISRLLFDYSMRNKTIDRTYIDKLIDIIVRGKSLENYVNNYEINNEKPNNNMIANYNFKSKIINIYLRGLIEQVKDEMKYIFFLPEKERYLYMNSIPTQVILHELEHANQKRIMQYEDNLESKILKLSDFKDIPEVIDNFEKAKQIDDYIKKYNELYLYVPDERLAEIKTFQEIIDALSIIKEYSSRIIELEELNKLANILRGYDDSYSPTITYLNKQGRNDDLKSFDWYSDSIEETIKLSQDKYTLRDRMKYGLPIDEKEHQYVKEIFRDMSFL